MPVAYRVRPGVLPGCAACSLVGHTVESSILATPAWSYASRTSSRELRLIRTARLQEFESTLAALEASGLPKDKARAQATAEIWPKHPEVGYEHWLLRGCEHARVLCEWPIRDRGEVETAWQDSAIRIFTRQAIDRSWSPIRMATVAKSLGFVPEGEMPALMACPRCAEALYADRSRPVLSRLADGRWQISAASGCSHIPDSDKSRADQAEQLADRWNAWAAKRLEERLGTDELAPGIKPAFAAAVAAR